MQESIRIITPDSTDFCKIGQPIKGEIVVFPPRQLEDATIGYRVSMEVKGKISTSVKRIDEIKLATQDFLREGQEYRFPFEFINYHSTYRGKNVDKFLKFEAFVKKSKRHLFDKSQLKKSIFLHYLPAEESYEVKEHKQQLKWDVSVLGNIFKRIKSSGNLIGGGIFIFFLLNTLFASEPIFLHFSIIKIMIGLSVSIGFIALLRYMLQRRMAEKYPLTAHFRPNNDREEFEVLLEHKIPSNKVQKMEVSYTIIEHVVDDRGTTNMHYRENLTKKTANSLNYVAGGWLATFRFSNKQPKPMQITDGARIYWQLNLEVHFNEGLIKQYSASTNFEVI